MNTTLIVITLILFAVVYASKRRFGLLGLALVAGSIISASWASYVTVVLQVQGIALLSPPLKVVVAALLVVLPVLFLVIVGPTYRKKWQRLSGSFLLSLFGTALMAAAIAREAPELAQGNIVIHIITQTYPIILVAGVILAILDIIVTYFPKKGRVATH